MDYALLTALSFAFQFKGWQHDQAWVSQFELQVSGFGFGALLTFLFLEYRLDKHQEDEEIDLEYLSI